MSLYCVLNDSMEEWWKEAETASNGQLEPVETGSEGKTDSIIDEEDLDDQITYV